ELKQELRRSRAKGTEHWAGAAKRPAGPALQAGPPSVPYAPSDLLTFCSAPADGRLPRPRVPQKLLQERVHPAEQIQPAAVQQRIVDIVGEHDQLVIDVALAQELHESHRLRERDVAVVIALNQEHRR